MTQRGLAYFIGEGATRALFALLLFAFASAASAGRVLVIYGPIFGPADFAVPLQAAGHTVDASNTVPASLDQYDQVWDVRLTGTDQSGTVITESQRAQYVAYLASGKKMFVVGDYSVAGPRNPSVISLIEAAGGGSLTAPGHEPTHCDPDCPGPFNGPNRVTTVTFQGAGGVMSPGSGQFITLNAPLRRESVSLSGWGRFVTPQAACWSLSLTSISPRMNGAVNPRRLCSRISSSTSVLRHLYRRQSPMSSRTSDVRTA